MLGQKTFSNEPNSTPRCPRCHRPAMAIEAVNAGIFVSGVFVRYSCRDCGTSDVQFLSIEEFTRSQCQPESKAQGRSKL